MKNGTPPKPASLLQAKWALIGGAIRMPSLSAGDCAVLWQICERYNEQAGAAWPSLSGLAADTKRDRKTVQRSIVKLIGAELLAVVRHGNRTESNRYRPEFDRFKVGAPTPLEVGAPVSEGRGASVPKVGAPTPLESSYEPGYETGVHSGSPAHAVAGAGGGAGPSLVAPSVPPSVRQFPAFWSAYPKATGVFKAEQTIGALLAEGVALAELVRGARAYAAWVQAQPWPDKDKYTKGPTNWLAARGWLDDYTVTPRQERPTKAPRSPPAPTKAKAGTCGAAAANAVAGIGDWLPAAEKPAAMRKLRARIMRLDWDSSALEGKDRSGMWRSAGEVLGEETVARWAAPRNTVHPNASTQQFQRLDAIVREYERKSRSAKKARSTLSMPSVV